MIILTYGTVHGNSISELTQMLSWDLRLNGHNVKTFKSSISDRDCKFSYKGKNSWIPLVEEQTSCVVNFAPVSINIFMPTKSIFIIDDTRWRTVKVKLSEIYSISTFSARELQRNLKVPVEPLTFRYKPTRLRAKLPVLLPPTLYTNIVGPYLPDNVEIYTTIAQVLPRKNLHVIAGAFARAFKNTGNKLWWLHIGDRYWVDDEYQKNLLDYIRKVYSALSAPYIVVTAFEAGPYWIDVLLNSSVAYLGASSMEGLGLPHMRALSLGKPVVAPVYAGPSDFLVPGKNCIPVSFGLKDSDEFLTKVADVSEEDYMHALRKDLPTSVEYSPVPSGTLTKELGFKPRKLKPGYTILVPFMGEQSVINPLLKSLRPHEKVIVALQGPHDIKAPSNVKIVRCNFENISMARNVCLAHVDTEQFVFLDADVHFEPGTIDLWHKLHLEVCRYDSKVQITVPLQVHPDTSQVVSALGPAGYMRPPSCRDYVAGEIYNIRGAAMMCNTETCLMPFDPHYSFFYDETDWLVHLLLSNPENFKCYYLPNVTIFHKEGSHANKEGVRNTYSTMAMHAVGKINSYLPPAHPAQKNFDVPLVQAMLNGHL